MKINLENIRCAMPVVEKQLKPQYQGIPAAAYSYPDVFATFWAVLVALHEYAVHIATPIQAYLPEAMMMTTDPFYNVVIFVGFMALSLYVGYRGTNELKERRMAAKLASLVGVAPEYLNESIVKGYMEFEPKGTKFPPGPYLQIHHNGEILRLPAYPPTGRTMNTKEILEAYQRLAEFCSDPPKLTADNVKESILKNSPLTMTGSHSKGVVTIYATTATGERKVFGLGSRVWVQHNGERFTVLMTCTHVLDQIRASNATDPGIEHDTKAGHARCFPRENSEEYGLFNWNVYTTSPQNQHDITMLIAPGPNRGQAVWQNMEVAPLALGALRKRAVIAINGQMPSGAKYHSEGYIMKALNGQLWHTASTTATTSGAPLMNKGLVVGVHAASGAATDGSFNVARSVQIFEHANRPTFTKESWETYSSKEIYEEMYDSEMYDNDSDEDRRQYEWEGMLRGSTRHRNNQYMEEFEIGDARPWGDRDEEEELVFGDMEMAYKLTHECSHGADLTQEGPGCKLCALRQNEEDNVKKTTQLKKAEKRGGKLLAALKFYQDFEADQAVIAAYNAAPADVQQALEPPNPQMYTPEPDRAKAYACAFAEEEKILAAMKAENTRDIPTDNEITELTAKAEKVFEALEARMMAFMQTHEATHADVPDLPEKPDPLINMSDKTTKLEEKMLAIMAKLDAADMDREKLRKAIRDTDAEAMANANARREALLKAEATIDAVVGAVSTPVNTKSTPAYHTFDADSDLESVASGFFDEKKESRQDFRTRESAAGSQTPNQRMHKLIEERKKAEKPSNRSWKVFTKLRQEMAESTTTSKKDNSFLQSFSKNKWMRASSSTRNGGTSAGANQ